MHVPPAVTLGDPWARLRQALTRRDAFAAREAAAQVPHVPLSEALMIVALVAEQDRARLPRYALAWHGRFCRELKDVGPDEAQAVLALLTMLGGPRQRHAARALAHLIADRRSMQYACKALLKLADRT